MSAGGIRLGVQSCSKGIRQPVQQITIVNFSAKKQPLECCVISHERSQILQVEGFARLQQISTVVRL